MKTIFEIAKSGMHSAERSLSVTANNVMNADTEGYSRQRIEKSPAGQQMHGYHAGLGVRVSGVTRLRNELTDLQLNDKRHEMGYLQEKARSLEGLEASVASDSGGDLDVLLGRLFDTFSELANDPQDFSVRNNLVSRASHLSEKLADMDRNIQRLSDTTRDSVTQNIGKINELVEELAVLNRTITTSIAMGRPDHASQDIQVKKLGELAELVDFDATKAKNGSLELTIGGIQVLTDDTSRKLIPVVDDTDKEYGLRLENGTKVGVTGGKLAAGMEMYQEILPGMKEGLDLTARTLVTEINEIHRQGYGLDDEVMWNPEEGLEGRNFFDPVDPDDPEAVNASNIRVSADILENHQHIAASSRPAEAGNGEMATGLADLRNQSIMDDRKPVDYAVNLISQPGSELSNVRGTMETRESEIRMLEVQQEREAGVNIDEELSLMIQYQNAYQGAARVLSNAQQMYDTLISLVR